MLLLAGAFAGLLGAVLGIGGGVFLVPALVLWGGLPMKSAVAAGLVAVIASSSAAGSVNVGRGTVNMRLGMVLELSTVLGALAGTTAAAFLPARLLIGFFGLLLLVVSGLLWRGPGDEGPMPHESTLGPLDGAYDDHGQRVSYRFKRLPAALGVSAAAGGLSGMLGVGGGVFKVPALHLFCGMPLKAAAATSNFMIGVTAAASAFLYYLRGDVLPGPTSAIVLGVLAGSLLGTRLSAKLKDSAVRQAFAVLTLFLAVQMLRRAWNG